MAGLGLARWIRDLNEDGAVALARGLLIAECGRHGLPGDSFTMTERVKAKDGGVDGRSNLPGICAPLYPTGPTIWQTKSGSTAPDTAKEFHTDKRAELRQQIADGWNYVLFWANDPSDPNLESVRTSFTTALQAIRSDVEVEFIFTDHIERMCRAHLGVAAEIFPALPLGGVISVDVWGHEEFPPADFQPDPLRNAHLERIQAHLASTDPPNTLHVFGDTGVGKSRLVFEALKSDGVRQRALIAPDADNLDRDLLAQTVQSPERSLIVVVDDCDADHRRSLDDYVGMAQGRIRLLTIGPRYSRAAQPQDIRYLELFPLEAEAAKHIASAVGLSDEEADLVSQYTEGYPGLALALAKAIHYGRGEDTTLVDRIRGHEEIGAVLASLLGDETDDLEPLGMLALFEKLGYEADLGYELTIACEALGVDEARVRNLAERESRRFVSTAGRYRNVSPRLFALWAAMRFVNDRQESLGDALRTLPPSLLQRVLSQMNAFAGDPAVEATLAGLLGDEPFRSGTLGDVGDGAARVLHVAALAAPSQCMSAIQGLLERANDEDLMAFGRGRREMVYALETLLWYDATFEPAASALLRLAKAENETWANNATNQFQGMFRVFLGGTEASYSRRIAWAREEIAGGDEAAARLVVEGLTNAFDSHENRFAPDFGGAPAPAEWRPATVADEIEARRSAWDLLVDIADGFESLSDEVGSVMAGATRTAIQRGLSDLALETLRERSWSSAARVRLAEALGHAIEYDEPSDEVRDQVAQTLLLLRGDSVADRADFVLSGSVWELAEGREEMISGRPAVVTELASLMAAVPLKEVLEVARRSLAGNEQTTGVLFGELARLTQDQDLLAALEEIVPRPDAAILGTFHGLAVSEGDQWVDRTLERWLDGGLSDLVLAAVHGLPATDARADYAVSAVLSGAIPPEAVTRFLYGGWTRDLSGESVVRLLSLVSGSSDRQAVENALGILEQWSEVNDATGTPQLRDIGLDLLRVAGELDGESAMVGLYRSRLIDRLGLSPDEQARVVFEHLATMADLPDQYDLEPFDRLAQTDPDGTTSRTLELLLSPDHSARWLESGKLLTRLAAAAGAEVVGRWITERVPHDQWHELVGHLDFDSDTPDPVFAKLLESGADERARDRAFFAFMYPRSGWMGSEAELLSGRLERGKLWADASDPDSPICGWLKDLRPVIESAISDAERREAERGW